MWRTIVLIIFLAIVGCSSKPNQLSDITIPVDSLIEIHKTEEAILLIRSLLATTTDDSLKAELYNRYADCKESENDSDSGMFYFNMSIEVWKQLSDTDHLMIVHKNIGDHYVANRNFKEANQHFAEALRNCRRIKDSIDVYTSVCVSYINQENFDSVHFYLKNFLVPYQEEVTWDNSYYIFFGKGLCFLAKENYDSALFFLQEALNRSPDDAYRANTFTNIAEVHKNMHNYFKALSNLDSAGNIYGDEVEWDENKQFYFDVYREVFDSLGDYTKAYHYAQKYRSISDSLYTEDNKDAMINAVAEAKTSAERAKTELARRSLIFTIIGLCLVALLALVAFRNTRIKQKANLLLTLQKEQVQQLADQLAIANDTKARLFSTIGHDLRSPVSTLYASLKMQELKGNAAGGEMSEQTVRLLDTLEELLIWSKSQMDGFKVQPVKINIRYFFEDLKEFYTTAAEAKNVSIVNDTTKDVVIRADENLLKTIFRNAISNAISNTQSGQSIQLTAQPATDGTMCMAVNNPCEEDSFHKFRLSFEEAVVKSGAYGLGIVLMKEFAQKLGGRIDLAYSNGSASLKLCV